MHNAFLNVREILVDEESKLKVASVVLVAIPAGTRGSNQVGGSLFLNGYVGVSGCARVDDTWQPIFLSYFVIILHISYQEGEFGTSGPLRNSWLPM